MYNFFTKNKLIFFLSNLILIIEYIYPGSLLGCIIFNDCKKQPQLTHDFIISANHFYSFFILSIIGFFTYKKNSLYKILIIYLLSLSLFLEILHLIVPNRSFELSDFFGNLFGILIALIIYKLIKKYEIF